jgi:hypothetical protein
MPYQADRPAEPNADQRRWSVGVDTHTDTHAAALVDALGDIRTQIEVCADPDGYARLLAWAGEHPPAGPSRHQRLHRPPHSRRTQPQGGPALPQALNRTTTIPAHASQFTHSDSTSNCQELWFGWLLVLGRPRHPSIGNAM